MAKFTNNTPGARGILLKNGAHKLVDAGQTVEIDDKDIESAHPDLEKGEAAAKKAVEADPAA
jgi:hypothetical protein